MLTEIFVAFLISAILTISFKWIFSKIGGTLYTSVRGGTPRAVGIAPFIVMITYIYFINPYLSLLIGIMGIFAFFDDVVGRRKVKNLHMEIGQLSRGMGMILVAILGFFYFGPASILIALMVQPMNIADMQPGSACSTVIILSIVALLSLFLAGEANYIIPLIILASCIGYAPLDYAGKIMMGEVGNHSFAVGLGVFYALLGGYLGITWGIGYATGSFLSVLFLFIFSSLIIALIRRKNLNTFLEKKIGITDPHYGDYV
ncbi:MAG: cell wall biosynthesis protein, partial [Methanobacterium sp.]